MTPRTVRGWQRRGVPASRKPIIRGFAEEYDLAQHWEGAKRAETEREVLIIAERMAGGRERLAQQMGVKPSTITRYVKRGVPLSRRDEVYDLAGELPPEPIRKAPKPREVRLSDLERMVSREGAAATARRLGIAPSTVRSALKKGRLTSTVRQRLEEARVSKKEAKLARQAAEENLLDMIELAGEEDAPFARQLRSLKAQYKGLGDELNAARARRRRKRISMRMRRELDALIDELKARRKVLFGEMAAQRRQISLPAVQGGTVKYEGPTARGVRYVKRWNLPIFSDEDIKPIVAWFSSHRRRYKFWQGLVTAAQYDVTGKGQNKPGYLKGVIQMGPGHQLPHPDPTPKYFTVNEIPSGRSTRRDAVADDIAAKLQEALEDGFMVQVLGTTMRNYELRTEQERLTWQAEKRRRQRKKGERRSRRQRSLS